MAQAVKTLTLVGIGLTLTADWFFYLHLEGAFHGTARQIKQKFGQAGLDL